MSLFNTINSQYQALTRAMDNRKTIRLLDAAAVMKVKPENVDHSLVVMNKRKLFGACEPYVDEQIGLVVLDARYAPYAAVKNALQMLGEQLIHAKRQPKKISEKLKQERRARRGEGVGNFIRDLAGSVLEGRGARNSFFDATGNFMRERMKEDELMVDTQDMEETLNEILTDAREMNALMLAYPDYPWTQNLADWLCMAKLTVQNWEGCLEAAAGKAVKGQAMLRVEDKLANEIGPEIKKHNAMIKRACNAPGEKEGDVIGRKITACCEKLHTVRGRIHSVPMRQAIDDIDSVLYDIQRQMKNDGSTSESSTIRSLENCYLPMVETLAEKFAVYETITRPDQITQNAMEETKRVMQQVVPNALRKIYAEMCAGSAIDLESQAVALRQKLTLDGLMG